MPRPPSPPGRSGGHEGVPQRVVHGVGGQQQRATAALTGPAGMPAASAALPRGRFIQVALTIRYVGGEPVDH